MLMAAICNINIFFHHKKITTIIIMLCLEDLSSNVLCRSGRRREKPLTWFLYPWGEDQICRWHRCWNACPLHKQCEGQQGDWSNSCTKQVATSLMVIASNSCWKSLFGLNQQQGCAPCGQPSHLLWNCWAIHRCLLWERESHGEQPLVFESSFKTSLLDLAVSKPKSVPLGMPSVPGCPGVLWHYAWI